FTAKKQHLGERSEDNLEYEIHLDKKERESAIQFFECLGFEKYFRKHKRGFSWHYEGIHIELLEVNDLGAFLEMEALLPFEADESAVSSAQDELYSIIDRFGLSDQIERTSYREMILNGIQSKPHTCK
ncbi:MAG TPA: CYTH domain-containing protein, partial [Candidatus Ornithospirochaeta stercorigallinarum]|nr:CYTH domain-containing protein [Candidatus Ornithospirochaeta stercorigallinarum]